jgi:alpha-maltose-1-phosphate synthase
MTVPTAININLSTSGSRLGGAAIASGFHCRYMAASFPVELWRMWDKDEECYTENLKVTSFNSKTNFGLFDQFFPKKAKSFFLDSNILKQLLSNPPKIIHLHNPLPSFAFEKIAVQASQSDIKVFASTHGFYEMLHPSYGLKLHEKLAWEYGITKPMTRSLKYLDGIFSLYPEESVMLEGLGVPKEKIHLTPNGVNPFFLIPPAAEEKNAVIQRFNLSLENPILLFIGNHTGNKGLDTVMKVAGQLSSPCTIVVGGKLLTPDEPQQWKQQFPVSPSVNVIFTDYLTTIEQRALYQLASVLLFPSLADTLPLTIIEAMASNLPVIAYDVGGIPYQLQDGCGILVKVGDTNSFLHAIEQAISNPAMLNQIALKAKARQESIFSWEKTAQTTIDVYKQFL